MPRNKHTLSHYCLLTGNMGSLYPIGLIEVLPKDTFQHSTSVFLRFSPLAAPVMHPIVARVHHFFVPHRLVWPLVKGTPDTGWEPFITGGNSGNDAQTIPTINTTGTAGDLFDYFHLPQESGLPVSELPIRGFNMIFNEWYRDQDLVTERAEDAVTVPLIAWEKDYLTTARATPQRGDDVTLPLGSKAPVYGIGKDNQTYGTVNQTVHEASGIDSTYANSQVIDGGAGANSHYYVEEDPDNTGYPNIYADLSAAGAINVNDMREAFALQRFQEARSRYGARYEEYLRYLGVRGELDGRINRPEFLGGGRARIAMSEVLQTANEAASDRFGVGDLYGHGMAATRSNAYRRTFNEHGYVFSLLSVRPKAMYQEGMSKTWLRRTKDEFWQRELEQIGQEEIWDAEVWSDTGDTTTEMYGTFGYQDRYSSYKFQQSRVAGEFRTTAAQSLDYWHLARSFSARPVLNNRFTDCNPSTRIFNVATNDTMWIAAQHHLVARRLVRRSGASRIL